MKKSKLLILLTASSVAAVTAVVLAPKANGSKLRASECDHDKYAYHYGYVAATADHVGRKEYWICCECNQVFFEKPDVGTFAEGKDDYFDTNVEHDVLIEAHEHYDVDPVDGHCDHEDCLEEVDYVTGSIIKPSRTIGRGETLHLSSDVKAYGKATSDVYYVVTDINGLASRVTLTDNEDGTADIESSENTENSVFKGTVSLYAAYDDSLLDSFELWTSTYGSSNRTPIKNFFATDDYHIIPFSYQSSFSNLGYELRQTIKTRDTYKEVVGEYLNQGTWSLVSESDEKTVFTLQVNGYFEKTYIAEITPTSTGAMVIFTCEAKEFVSFPSEQVQTYVSEVLEATGTVPEFDDGISYLFVDDTGYYAPGVIVNCLDSTEALESYLSILENNGWFVFKESYSDVYYGYDGKTLLINPYEYSDGLMNIDLYVNPTPVVKPSTADSWPSEDVANEVSILGATGTVPAFDGGTDYLFSENTGYGSPGVTVTVESASDAYDSYLSILEDNGWFVYNQTSTDVYYGYEGETLLINPYVYGTKLNIDFIKSFAPVVKPDISWPSEKVSTLISNLGATGTAPACEGGSKYEASANADYSMPGVLISADSYYTVAENYKAKLLNEGWFETTKVLNYPTFAYEGETLAITVYTYSGDVYVIFSKLSSPAVKPEPQEETGSEFPAEEIASYLTGISTSDLPVMEEGLFEITSASTDYVYVKATSSDIVAFRNACKALPNAQKQDGAGNSWGFGNGLYINITPGADYTQYTINFYVFSW